MPPDDSPRPKTQQSGLTLGEGAQITIGQGDVVAGDKIVYASKEDARTRRDHLILLNKVKEFWVKGVLEKSVHSEAVIELGKEVAAEAIDRPRPWDMTLEVPDQSSQPIPPNKKIIELFGEMEHALLILGAPGSGKTITLLELARDLIARAEADPAQPLPVVFNLSAWAERRQPLAEWMTDELSLKYQIPRKIGRKWLAEDDILPLLDGLDEVRAEHRSDCVEAINKFYSEHSLAGVAVCSRHEEYGLLKAKLKLGGAILIQPLNDEQVTDYLASFGTKLAGLYKALRLDVMLKELSASPLMLGVMSLAYTDVSLEEVLRGKLDSIEARRKHLFDAYVERMFKRKGVDPRYSQEQTLKWLAWLARRMKAHGQSVFLIEGLQPSWIASRKEYQIYLLGSRIAGGMIGELFGLALWLAMLPFIGFDRGLTLSLVLLGFFSPLGIMIGGLLIGRLANKRKLSHSIQTVEALNWSWRSALRRGIIVWLGVGLIVGLPLGLLLWLVEFLNALSSGRTMMADVSLSGLMQGLTCGWFLGLISGLFGGLSSKVVDIKTKPNQGIHLSFRNAILAGFVSGLSLGLVSGMVVGLRFGLMFGLTVGLGAWAIPGLTIGPIVGLFVFFQYGGITTIQHYTLRLILAFNKYLPLNLTGFLDHCAERIFLQKVGGGYIFIHRLLLEYFAEREQRI